MTVYLSPTKSFRTFRDASAFARTEAIRERSLLTVRRRKLGGFEVCVKDTSVIVEFRSFATECEVVLRDHDIGELRKVCIEEGLSPAGWRFLVQYGARGYEVADHPSIALYAKFLNALCYVDWQSRAGLSKPFPQVLGEKYILVLGLVLSMDFDVDPRIAQVGNDYWSTLRTSELRNAFAENEWVKVLVWMRDEQPVFDRNQWRAGWQAIWRCYRKWECLNSSKYDWPSRINVCFIGDWNVRPLTNSYEVALEGIRMKHCVASYAKRCAEGSYRLFSIAEHSSDASVATVGIERIDGQWQVDQVRGKCNQHSDSQLILLADKLCERYQSTELPEIIPCLKETESYIRVKLPEDHRQLLRSSRYLTSDLERILNSKEILFLEKYANWLDGLVSGALAPLTKDQQHFIGVAHGEYSAESDPELIWRKYQCYLKQYRKCFENLRGQLSKPSPINRNSDV